MLMIMKSHCLSAIDYGCEAIIGSAKTNLDAIEATEHKSLTNSLGVSTTCARNESRALADFVPLKQRWAIRVFKF
ncbi:hypothetical protein MHBO_003626 [Bonamia ostreae]|uniref:Uncharacterized protein n=1 Tax=Bonamia ostreae TaxID=126728 RepID=A0ABV2AR11_9EUKA